MIAALAFHGDRQGRSHFYSSSGSKSLMMWSPLLKMAVNGSKSGMTTVAFLSPLRSLRTRIKFSMNSSSVMHGVMMQSSGALPTPMAAVPVSGQGEIIIKPQLFAVE
ncbi:MAG TPA: hypothetical protein VH643_17490 [Gemmataceae bacterium]